MVSADLDAKLLEDVERMRAQQSQAAALEQQMQQQRRRFGSGGSEQAQQGDSPLDAVKEVVDKVLIADFFFVLFALGWLGAGLAERSAVQSTVGGWVADAGWGWKGCILRSETVI